MLDPKKSRIKEKGGGGRKEGRNKREEGGGQQGGGETGEGNDPTHNSTRRNKASVISFTKYTQDLFFK